MEMNFQIDLSGWETAFDGTARRLNHLEPVHRQIGELGVEMTKNNIDAGGGSETWEDLAASTLLARARNPSGKEGKGGKQVFKRGRVHGPISKREHSVSGGETALTKRARRTIENAKPLYWTGKLYKSITYSETPDYVDVGSPLIQSRRLFYGYDGKIKTPARSPFGFRPNDAEDISRLYARYIFGEIAE